MGKKFRPFQLINTKYLDKLDNKAEPKMFSRIEQIPVDAKVELYNVTSNYRIKDCNEKADIISQIMEPLGFVEIGCGTNRVAFRKNNYVYKVALSERGFIDNVSEYKRSFEIPQAFYKVYETNRAMLVGEYLELMTEEYFVSHLHEIRAILEMLSNYYVMWDIGLTTKNYCNWGLRTNPDGSVQPVIIDNAYFYPIRNKDMVMCSCGGKIVHSDDFTYYRCSNSSCALNYTVPEILNMSKFDFDSEDEEAIKLLTKDGSEKYIKVSGTNSGMIEQINKTEAEQLLASYKDATTFDASTINIVEDVEDYWLNETDNDSNVPKYNALDLGGNKK